MNRQLSPTIEDASSEGKFAAVGKPSIHLEEAAELYGSVAAAYQNNYVARGLKSRHIQLIGLGGSIGTGLFLGVGRSLTAGGPLSMLLGFAISGVSVYGMMQCLGELVTWLPLPGATPSFATRYVDSALGFAIGWMGWYTFSIAVCSEISAGAIIVSYWDTSTSPRVDHGHDCRDSRFWFASVKLITIVGLLILALVLDLGGGPTHDRLGFRYWQNPGAMNTFIADGDLGRFSGFAFCLILGAHTYAGVETVAIAGGEAQDPRRALPRAIRRVFWRILFFYIIGTLAIGVLVPYNSPSLLTAQVEKLPGAAGSPWVIAINRAGIYALPSIINAAILSSAISSANAYLYNGSRYLLSMAQSNLAPRIFLRCSKNGIPYYCVGLTAVMSSLTYLSCADKPAQKQGMNRDDLQFKSPFQLYLAWACLISFLILITFNGFYAFTPWNPATFISVYISIPCFLAFYFFWKVYKRTKLVDPAEADLWTGKAVIDAQIWPEKEPRNMLEKFWIWAV